jgi:hypothetical protein
LESDEENDIDTLLDAVSSLQPLCNGGRMISLVERDPRGCVVLNCQGEETAKPLRQIQVPTDVSIDGRMLCVLSDMSVFLILGLRKFAITNEKISFLMYPAIHLHTSAAPHT